MACRATGLIGAPLRRSLQQDFFRTLPRSLDSTQVSSLRSLATAASQTVSVEASIEATGSNDGKVTAKLRSTRPSGRSQRKPPKKSSSVRRTPLQYTSKLDPLNLRRRVNVTSPELCDDIIEYMGSSLDRHHKCDIIDINPGNAVWSQKLHKRLKPRKHLLVESDKERYMKYLEPLLKKKRSTYEHVDLHGMDPNILHKIHELNLLPRQKWREPGDPARQAENNSLLISATIAQDQRLVRGLAGSLAHYFLYDMFADLLRESAMNGYGVVRILLWTRDGDKHHILPRRVKERDKTSAIVEIACKSVEEIAGGDSDMTRHLRGRQVHRDSAALVQARMQSSGKTRPSHRQSHVDFREHELSDDAVLDSAPSHLSSKPWRHEFVELEARYAKGEIQPGSEAHDRIVRLRENSRRIASRLRKSEDYHGQALALEKIESEDNPEQREHAKALRHELRRLAEAMPPERLMHTHNMVDEIKALRNTPPLLMWDRRSFEPLVVQPEDFTKQCNLALLDILPKPLSSPWLDKTTNAFILDFLLANLFAHSVDSVREALNKTATGAGDALVPKIPSLLDLSRGGVTQPEDLRVRMMTAQMIEELFVAWQSWPFRYDLHYILAWKHTTLDIDPSEDNSQKTGQYYFL